VAVEKLTRRPENWPEENSCSERGVLRFACKVQLVDGCAKAKPGRFLTEAAPHGPDTGPNGLRSNQPSLLDLQPLPRAVPSVASGVPLLIGIKGARRDGPLQQREFRDQDRTERIAAARGRTAGRISPDDLQPHPAGPVENDSDDRRIPAGALGVGSAVSRTVRGLAAGLMYSRGMSEEGLVHAAKSDRARRLIIWGR